MNIIPLLTFIFVVLFFVFVCLVLVINLAENKTGVESIKEASGIMITIIVFGLFVVALTIDYESIFNIVWVHGG